MWLPWRRHMLLLAQHDDVRVGFIVILCKFVDENEVIDRNGESEK